MRMNKLEHIIISFICGVVIVLLLIYFFLNLYGGFFREQGENFIYDMAKMCVGSTKIEEGIITFSGSCNANIER